MKTISNKPQALQNKVLLTFLAGAACCIFGIGYFLFSHDRIFLILSIILMVACFARGLELYYIIASEKFEEIIGTCIGIASSPIKKLRSVKLMDDDGNELLLKLNKTDKLIIGGRYRFYFKSGNRIQTGYDFLDARLSSDNYLGYEQIQSTEKRKNTPSNSKRRPARSKK